MPATERPLPITDNPLYKAYFDYAKAREFRLQKCNSCARYLHLPVETCPNCSSSDLGWALLSGRAVVDSFLIINASRSRRPEAADPKVGLGESYVVAQVNPEEAPYLRVVGNVVECPEDNVYVGMPLTVTFMDLTPEYTIPQFKPA